MDLMGRVALADEREPQAAVGRWWRTRVIYCAGKLEGIYDNKEEAAVPQTSLYYKLALFHSTCSS